VHQRGAS